jgi:hypothetical protein
MHDAEGTGPVAASVKRPALASRASASSLAWDDRDDGYLVSLISRRLNVHSIGL